MSRLKGMGHREELRARHKVIEAEIPSHSGSIRVALPLTREPEDIDGEYAMTLTIKLNERVQELRNVRRKISVLERELGL